jgi:hypothetical protein
MLVYGNCSVVQITLKLSVMHIFTILVSISNMAVWVKHNTTKGCFGISQ